MGDLYERVLRLFTVFEHLRESRRRHDLELLDQCLHPFILALSHHILRLRQLQFLQVFLCLGVDIFARLRQQGQLGPVPGDLREAFDDVFLANLLTNILILSILLSHTLFGLLLIRAIVCLLLLVDVERAEEGLQSLLGGVKFFVVLLLVLHELVLDLNLVFCRLCVTDSRVVLSQQIAHQV